MKIKELTLYTNKIAEQKHFFETILGFTVHQENSDIFWIQVGWTKFCFKRSYECYLYHYCFLIPGNKLQEALGWVESKVEIIEAEENGKVVFFDTWNAHSFYFYDGVGNIAECIVRHDLQNHSDKPFSITDFLCVNEIGLGTDNISKTNQQLEDHFGTPFWRGDKARFAANGSQEGLFLMPNYRVKETWFPTEIAIEPNPLIGIVENERRFYNFQFIDGEIKSHNAVSKIDTYWNEFQDKHPAYLHVGIPLSYHFCDNEKDADECAELVCSGIKQATTHSLSWLHINNEKMPAEGDLAIVTDWNGNPVAVTKTTKVEIVQFKDITPEYAFIEGEGDKSLSYWKEVHWAYYTRELCEYNLKPTLDMELVCEYFETIWPVVDAGMKIKMEPAFSINR